MDEQIKISVIISNRKSIGIQIKPDGQVIVRAPRGATMAEIKKVVHEHEDWIRKHLEKVKQETENSDGTKIAKLTSGELKELGKKALEYIPERVAYYAPLIGVTYGRITIRSQRTRWGSCSSQGNLNFNCLLMLMPPQVIDSVVVHELCHRKEMNHSKAFYQEIYKVFPEYKQWDRWLKNHGKGIMARL